MNKLFDKAFLYFFEHLDNVILVLICVILVVIVLLGMGR